MKRLSIILCLLITQICYSAEFKGLLSLNNVSAGSYKIPKIEVKYRIYTLMGEPCKAFVMKYSSENNAKLRNIKLRARVSCGIKQDAFVSFSPLIAKANKWGFDVSGSPNWGELFYSNSGTAISAGRAKQYFKDGFSLVDLEVLEISAEEFNPFNDKYNGKFYKAKKNSITDLENNLPNNYFSKQKKRDKSKIWGGKSVYGKWGNLSPFKNSQYTLMPDDSTKHISTETMFWEDKGKYYQAYRIILNSMPVAKLSLNKRSKELSTLEITQKWFEDTQQVSKINYSTKMNIGDKIVFVKSSDFKYGKVRSYKLILEHILPNQDEEPKKNPFEQTDKIDPFANLNNAPENPLEKADRLEAERLEQIRIAEEKARLERERLASIQAENARLAKIQKRITLQEEIRAEGGKSLGEITVEASRIDIFCWDHGDEDGDKVKILNNGSIEESLTLKKSGEEVSIYLDSGYNKITIKAINQGSSGDNTASFQVKVDDKIVSNKKWDLKTDEHAVLLIYKK